MKLLLDTHIFLWYITADTRLAATLVSLLRDPANDVHLSAVSLWEIIVKHQIGKLPLPQPPELYVPQQRRAHGISSLDLDEESVARLAHLPLLHRDPFDRMLLCQSLHHGLSLVSVDSTIQSYSSHVPVVS